MQRTSPELEVGFFEFDSYLRSWEGPPQLISPADISAQACRVRITYREPREDEEDEEVEEDEAMARKIWVTIGLTKDTVII
ncbi:hypothetical protein EW145_g4895 [Phellinidium pouzarii]|uniref:Uncharacterized protein n=1 Tax=Phellinidium pouzarii TaxID=167371 RepID=A0A4S4L231_9AGAM|nr:hypothetical protein EW145_g4895 [Phellinidium pouzarii]